MKEFELIPYCSNVALLSEAVEQLIEVVQNYVERGLEIDLNEIFEAGESGLTLETYNQFVDSVNAKILSQTKALAAIH